MQNNFHILTSFRLVPAIAWLVMQLLMTGLVQPSNALADTDGFSLTSVICTSSGFKVITLDEKPSAPENSANQECEWCQAFGNTAPLKISGELVRLSFDFGRHSYQPQEIQFALNLPIGSTAPIRAPPL